MPTPRYPGDYAPLTSSSGGKSTFSLEFIASEIRRREMMQLNFLGELCVIYLAKQEGPPCSCYREYQGQATDPDCELCFGTGFIGGYDLLTVDRFVEVMQRINLDVAGVDTLVTANYKYVDQLQEKEIASGKFLVRFPSVDNAVNNDRLRLYDSLSLRGWTTLTYPLKPRDVLVRPNGGRYRVKSVRAVKNIRGTFTHQKFDLQLVDQADSVYNIGTTPLNFESSNEFEFGQTPPFVLAYGGGFFLEQQFGLFDFGLDFNIGECLC